MARSGRADRRKPAALDDDLAAQFARLGAPVGAALAPQVDTDAVEIMAPNAQVLRVWLACETQWRVVSGMRGVAWLGLDYGAADVVLRRVGLEPAEANEVFGDLLVMEAEALAAFGETDK